MPGEMLIRWTARIAVACYLARLIADVKGRSSDASLRMARWWWTAGFLIFLLHVAAAFQLEFGWNHDVAYDYTFRRTTEMTGWKSGAGLYVNEAFLLLWMVDTCVWWRDLNWPRNRLAYGVVQAIFGFLMIQATAVFGPPFWKPVVAGALAYLMFQLFRTRRKQRI